jgi:hypothetical protein
MEKKTKGELEIIRCYELLEKLATNHFRNNSSIDPDTLHAIEMINKEFYNYYKPQI